MFLLISSNYDSEITWFYLKGAESYVCTKLWHTYSSQVKKHLKLLGLEKEILP